jgi:hypothetical protein
MFKSCKKLKKKARIPKVVEYYISANNYGMYDDSLCEKSKQEYLN